MANAAHTRGPWHSSPTHLGLAFDIGAADGDNIALVYGPEENGSVNFSGNARLIAAAPDLFSALEAVNMSAVSLVEGDFSKGFLVDWASIQLVMTAIAKATRGAS